MVEPIYSPHPGDGCQGEPFGLPCDKMGHQAANTLLRHGFTPEGAKAAPDGDLLDLRNFGAVALRLLRAGAV